jgi:hypothetical protein
VDSGAFVVLASNQVQFFNRYHFLPFGEYQGQLDNAGERVVLVQANGDTIFSIRYDDEPPWPVEADTLGYSLVPISTSPALDLNNGANWTTSAEVGGSPGRYDLASAVKEINASAPQTFALFQNYPNPFNPRTSIQYSVISTQHVRLKIYDLLGREVATLVDEVMQPGTYTVQWDARLRHSDSGGQVQGLASGVYFYRLKAGNFVETKKLVLVR